MQDLSVCDNCKMQILVQIAADRSSVTGEEDLLNIFF